MRRLPAPSRALAALLAAALIALSAAPAEAAQARMDCCGDHCPARTDGCSAPDAAPGRACCVAVPTVPHAAATAPVAPAPLQALVAVVLEAASPRTAPRRRVRPRDTGPPPPGRRHLALSVLQV